MPVEAEEVESEDEVEEEAAVTEPRRVVMMVEEGQPTVSGCIDRKAKPCFTSSSSPGALICSCAAAADVAAAGLDFAQTTDRVARLGQRCTLPLFELLLLLLLLLIPIAVEIIPAAVEHGNLTCLVD